MGHHPDPIPRRLQIQPRWDLNLFIPFINGRGQDMDPIEERVRKVLADRSDRVLELVHVPEPIRRQVSNRRNWWRCTITGITEPGPPSFISRAVRLKEGRPVL